VSNKTSKTNGLENEGTSRFLILDDFRARLMIIAVGFIAALMPWVTWSGHYDLLLPALSLLDSLNVMDIDLVLIAFLYLVGLIMCVWHGYKVMILGTVAIWVSIIAWLLKVYYFQDILDPGYWYPADAIGAGLIVGSIVLVLLVPFTYGQYLRDRRAK
jgi:hypothetical protein